MTRRRYLPTVVVTAIIAAGLLTPQAAFGHGVGCTMSFGVTHVGAVITGTPGPDIINCSGAGAVAHSISGGGGNDTIVASPGNDGINGGPGHDTISGGTGDDYIEGHIGDDTLDGGPGDDIVIGSEGNDVLFGGFGRDQLSAEDGNDIVVGPDGDGSRDNVIGGGGTDVCIPFNPGAPGLVGVDPDYVDC